MTVSPATSPVVTMVTSGGADAGLGDGAGGLGQSAMARRWAPDWYPGLAFLSSPIRFSEVAPSSSSATVGAQSQSYSPGLPDRIRWASVSGAPPVQRAVVAGPAQATLMADSARMMEAQSFPVRWPWLMAEPLPPAVPATATMGASPADGPR